MLPHQGAGAGQGLEDALILAALLSTKNLQADQLTDVSSIYEKLRLKRACRVQQTSRESGEIYECYSTQYQRLPKLANILSIVLTGYGNTISNRMLQKQSNNYTS